MFWSLSVFLSTQLTPYRQSPEEYGLSLNADVALWLDSRAYNNQPPLRQFCDFVFITSDLSLGDDEMGPNYLINTGGYCMTTPAAHVGVALCNIRRPRALINILGTSGFPIHPLEAGF